ncbi:MAG: FHA domain-containing protein [Polyangiales bacterium]
MPVTLVVRRRGEVELAPVSFDAQRVAIGRGASCDLRIPDASVSSRHASIRANGAQWVVVDEGSTNGTKLNGEKLASQSPRPLKTGDVLAFGRIDVTVKIGAAPASTAQQTREIALALVSRAVGDQEAKPRVVVAAGADAGASIELAGSKTIGRDPRCALRLTDRAVPPIALEVTVEGSRVRVVRRDDRTEAKMGERPIGDDPIAWGDGMVVTVASTSLVLEDPIARALDASSHGEDEKLSVLPPAPEPVIEEPPPPEPAPVVEEQEAPKKEPERPKHDRRKSWRGATFAFEIIALVLALAVLGGSIAGLVWLLRK